MTFFFTHSFIRDYRSLPPHFKKTTDKQLALFIADPQRPSLHIKKMYYPHS